MRTHTKRDVVGLVLIAIVLGGWLCALAADPDVRWRRTGLEAPMGALLLVMLLSLTANVDRVNAASGVVIKDVIADAFLVRMLIVPAVMSIIGERIWWLPKWLDRILPTIDVEGHAEDAAHFDEEDDESELVRGLLGA